MKITRSIDRQKPSAYILVLGLLCVITSAITSAQDVQSDTPEPTSEEWQVSFHPVEPYFWFADTDATATVGTTSLPIELDFFEDAVANMGDGLHVRIELHLEAQRNRWTFLFDPTRLEADSAAEFEQGEASTASTFKMIDAKVGYQVYPGLDAFFGMRYAKQNIRIHSDELEQRLKGETQWWSPVIGLRYRRAFSDNWHFSSGAYYARLNPDDRSDSSWDANVILSYHYNDWLAFNFGYRIIFVEFEEGDGINVFNYDARMKGPLLGLNIDFF